jgi:hypothetical protein
MTVASRTQKIDELFAKASAALAARGYFDAEQMAGRAMELARSGGEFHRMAAMIPTLTQARMSRLDQAMKVGKVTIHSSPFTETDVIQPGCHLFQPPQVGADARRFRLLAHQQQVVASVLCREPVIRMGLVPIVAIAPGATVRCKVRPPADMERPSVEWFADALEALGDAATEIDPQLDVEKRIDAFMARLDAIPDHEGLHRCLERTCREAAEARPKAAADE